MDVLLCYDAVKMDTNFSVFRTIGVDFDTIDVDFGTIDVDLGTTGVDLGTIDVDLGTIDADFRGLYILIKRKKKKKNVLKRGKRPTGLCIAKTPYIFY